MKRRSFIWGAIALFPVHAFATMKSRITGRTNKGFVVKNGDARFGVHYKMKGITSNILDIKISSEDTDGNLAIFEQTGLTPNGGPPLHIHPEQDEWFYVIDGEYLFQVGEERHELKSGDTIFLPRNVKHAFVQLSETGKMIVSYLPAGKMESFFKVTNNWTRPPEKQQINQTFEEHGMTVVGPPITRIP